MHLPSSLLAAMFLSTALGVTMQQCSRPKDIHMPARAAHTADTLMTPTVTPTTGAPSHVPAPGLEPRRHTCDACGKG